MPPGKGITRGSPFFVVTKNAHSRSKSISGSGQATRQARQHRRPGWRRSTSFAAREFQHPDSAIR